MISRLVTSSILAGFLLSSLSAQEGIELAQPSKPNLGWTFDNGQEFPGAKGSLSLDETTPHGNKPALKLEGDFTGGGGYVQMMSPVPDVDPESLSFWLKFPGASALTIRIIDAASKCHQIVLKIHETSDWQLVQFPLGDFFNFMGTTRAVAGVVQYERWGGTKDDRWAGPAKSFCILLGKRQCSEEKKRCALWGTEVRFLPRAVVASTDVRKTLRLDEFPDENETGWRLNLGWEFPGAKAELKVAKDQPETGKSCLHLSGDFTKGGGYVAAEKLLTASRLKSVESVAMRIKSDNVKSFSLRLVDGSGQCHQRKNNTLAADGEWHDFVFRPAEVAGGEHWGGANDGQWHQPLKLLSMILPATPAEVIKPELFLAGVKAEVVLAAEVSPASFVTRFENPDEFGAGWTIEGRIFVDSEAAAEGKKSLCLARAEERLEDTTAAASPVFPAAPGTWLIAAACKSDLHSPDNSYHGMIQFELLDAAGRVLDSREAGIQFGKTDWQKISRTVEAPKGTAAARFRILLNKTHGVFHVDELSAAHLAHAAERLIERVLLASDRLGNLFFPEDDLVIHATVEALKPLPTSQQAIHYLVRDYWGAEQCLPLEAPLEKAGKTEGGLFLYKASFALKRDALEIGKYYEIHAEIPCEGDEPFKESTAFARLPIAETKQYRPEEIPFTSRNWDNRIREYFFLSDRLGIRACGIWGGWDAEPPYKTQAPGIQWCKQLDMAVLSGTPASIIEGRSKGYEHYDEKALREGVRRFIKEYAKDGLKIIVLGNEPHGADRVAGNVEAYRVLYEEIKKTDPSITVVGTSVGPEEDYFKAGFQKYQDFFNFHAYADYHVVPAAFRRYEELFAKYGGRKPIWSTELGLNSQGMTRLTVAVDLIKKLTLFFAHGGENCSWFTILYPDPKGKARGTFGDAHCVFDCRYNLYNPRLDAIACYNLINGICVKKIIAQKTYEEDIRAFLFRDKDGRCLQVLWKEDGRADIFLPLHEVGRINLIRTDGSSGVLDASGRGVTLGVSPEPLLLLYEQNEGELPQKLGAPFLALQALPTQILRGGKTGFIIECESPGPDALEFVLPPFWEISKERISPKEMKCSLSAPAVTQAREGRILVRMMPRNGSAQGELYLEVPIDAAHN